MESTLPGLQRLLEVCARLGIRAQTSRPRPTPPLIAAWGGQALDPVLAATYTRVGHGSFADDLYILRVDAHEDQLEEQNRWWREGWQARLPMPLFLFGGKASLAYYFATVPGLADAQGRQPVVQVDTYDLDGPYALPIASNVDRFFEAYSRYLEVLVADPGFETEGTATLTFPRDVPEVLARDERLVELIRAGRFDPLMPGHEERAWAARVVAAAEARH